MQVDLGCIRYTNKKGEQCHRYFLNCINIGLIADVMNMRRQTRSLLGSRTLSFIVSIFLMIFHRMDYKMNVKINSDVINRKVMTMCIGSGLAMDKHPMLSLITDCWMCQWSIIQVCCSSLQGYGCC